MRILQIAIFTFFALPGLGLAEIIVCEGQEPGTEFRREIRLSFEHAESHLIQLETLNDQVYASRFISDASPVSIGSIEIYDLLDNQRNLWADGDLIVTQANTSLMTGIHFRLAKIYTIRVDKIGNKWDFIFHDQSRKETLVGECQ